MTNSEHKILKYVNKMKLMIKLLIDVHTFKKNIYHFFSYIAIYKNFFSASLNIDDKMFGL